MTSPLQKIAMASGQTRFFTGNPCRNGHLSERLTCSGDCVQCRRNSAARSRKKKQKARGYKPPKARESCGCCEAPLTPPKLFYCSKACSRRMHDRRAREKQRLLIKIARQLLDEGGITL